MMRPVAVSVTVGFVSSLNSIIFCIALDDDPLFERGYPLPSLVKDIKVNAKCSILLVAPHPKNRLALVSDEVGRVDVGISAKTNSELIFNFPHTISSINFDIASMQSIH